jgi:hypothetical protein
MTDRIIVSRHTAAVEFIRSAAPEFETAPVVAQASPKDVRGKIVAGNLPLSLAALAAEVIAVEFDGTPPRGQEYTAADMAAAGAVLRRYRVQSVTWTTARQITWSNKIGHRGRRPFLLFIHEGKVRPFMGQHIPGVVVVRGTDFTQDGKWSHTTYRLQTAAGVREISGREGWETGRFTEGLGDAVGVPTPDTWADVATALGVSVASAMEFLRDWRPDSAQSLDAVQRALEALEETSNQQ